MVLKLYITESSPPCMSVYMTAKALGINLELISLDFGKKEHLSPEFISINPQHTVPTIIDGNNTIWDSHAINIYLFEKFGKLDNNLYPQDLYLRAMITQRMHFDSCNLFSILRLIIRSYLYEGITKIHPDYIKSLRESYEILEGFLQKTNWIVADTVTLADFHIIPSLLASSTLVTTNPLKYPKIVLYLEKAQNLEYFTQRVQDGMESLSKLLQGIEKVTL